ncbi:MAG: methyltransferase [Myxococcota bacterium]|nr:methyltransferase [Myxococcota bacterium]
MSEPRTDEESPRAAPRAEEAPALPWVPHWWIARLALDLRRFLLRLAARILPPHAALFELATGGMVAAMLQRCVVLGIPDLLERGPLSADDLAEQTGSHPDRLHRVLRACVSSGVFTLRSDGRFANNYLSRALRSGVPGSFRDPLDYFTSPEIARVWGGLPAALDEAVGGYEQEYGQPVWDWYEDHPQERARVARSMTALSALDAVAVARSWPFGSLRCLGDVGGGQGVVLAEILRRNPALRGMIVDSAGVVGLARGFLADRGLLHRVDLREGDFFDEVPRGCDGLLLKNILHDWDDPSALAILKVCRSALQTGQPLLVVEMVQEPHAADRVASLSDVHMMIATVRGRERSREELESLLVEAGFRPVRFCRLPGVQCLLEGRAE